jgi:hypothetical protein
VIPLISTSAGEWGHHARVRASSSDAVIITARDFSSRCDQTNDRMPNSADVAHGLAKSFIEFFNQVGWVLIPEQTDRQLQQSCATRSCDRGPGGPGLNVNIFSGEVE